MPAAKTTTAMIVARIGIPWLLVIVTPVLCQTAEPPLDLAKRVAQQEAETEAERNRYLYRQKLRVSEAETRGRYEETREILFLPDGRREDRMVGRPTSALQRLILTEEDFEDIRNIQPMLLTPETLPLYQTRFRGEEKLEEADCWVLEVKPRQVFQGQRYFEGLLYIDKSGLAVVRIEGQAVPPIYRNGKENLFPRFVTLRQKVDGKHWFPRLTWADDTLPFKSGGLRMKLEIRYEDYRRFGAESSITYEEPKPPRR